MLDNELQKILLIEDEQDIQLIVKLALESLGGFIVEVCSSGNEALQKAPIFKPQLILLDVMMPEMDGLTTYKLLKDIPQLTDTEVIFLTAKVQQSELQLYKQIGALDVIAKPFDPMTISEQIKNIWLSRYGSQ